MNLEKYATILSLIISFISTMNRFSKSEKISKLSEDYFEKVISLYVKEYRDNPSIDPLDFIKRKFDIRDYFIPSYIFYLVDKGEKEKLHKILLVDYREKYPNKQNSIFNGLDNIGATFMYILVFVYSTLIILAFISGIFLLPSLITDMVSYHTISNNNIRSIAIIILYFIIGIIIMFILQFDIHDDYVMKNKQIEKVIKRKEKEFKNNNKYYI